MRQLIHSARLWALTMSGFIASVDVALAGLNIEVENNTQQDRDDPILNRTIFASASPRTKFWVTETGRVYFFFVFGEINEFVFADLNAGENKGFVSVQYDRSGRPVNYSSHVEDVISVAANYTASAVSNGLGRLNFTYSLNAQHDVNGKPEIETVRHETIIEMSSQRCVFSVKYIGIFESEGKRIRDDSFSKTSDCNVHQGLK